jgi:hypothetical protein
LRTPRLPTFGVPCPTTILTIGFLLATDRLLPRSVAVVPLVWAFIGGSAAFLLGVRADAMLLAAGIVLAIDIIHRMRVEPVQAPEDPSSVLPVKSCIPEVPGARHGR